MPNSGAPCSPCQTEGGAALGVSGVAPPALPPPLPIMYQPMIPRATSNSTTAMMTLIFAALSTCSLLNVGRGSRPGGFATRILTDLRGIVTSRKEKRARPKPRPLCMNHVSAIRMKSDRAAGEVATTLALIRVDEPREGLAVLRVQAERLTPRGGVVTGGRAIVLLGAPAIAALPRLG